MIAALIALLLLIAGDYPPSPPPSTSVPPYPPPPASTVQPSPVGELPPPDRRTLMGEIDKLYKAEKARADLWQAIADDLADVLNHLLFHHADAGSEVESEIEAALARYREMRDP